MEMKERKKDDSYDYQWMVFMVLLACVFCPALPDLLACEGACQKKRGPSRLLLSGEWQKAVVLPDITLPWKILAAAKQ